METPSSMLMPQLRISPRWAILLPALLGMLLVPLSRSQSSVPHAPQPINLTVPTYALAVIVWLIDRRLPRVSRWFTSATLLAFVLLGILWLNIAGFLALIPLPVLLTALLISPAAAIAVAITETLSIVLLPRYLSLGQDSLTTFAALAAVWSTIGAVFAVYRPIYHLAGWFEQSYDRAEQFLEEARNRKAELDQTVERLAHTNRQLALASERMAALRMMAEQAERTKTMFLAKVSHEFRTPLNMILGLVSLIVRRAQVDDEDIPPRLMEDLGVVHRNCEHLSAMINDVLDLSQMDAGRLTLHRELVDLGKAIDSALAIVRPLMEKKGLQLRKEIPMDLPLIYCDPVRVRQVLLNLLSNAARFTTHGYVEVMVALQDQKVTVSVTDTGPGIAAEDTERIFEPFDQGMAHIWRDKGGSGLGLAVSRQFIKLHSGRMWLESRPDVGSTFAFELPIGAPREHITRPGHWIRRDWVWREHTFKTDGVISSDELSRPRIVVLDETGGLRSQFMHYTDEIEFVSVSDLEEAVRSVQECPAHIVVVNAASVPTLWPLVEALAQEAPHTAVIGYAVPRPVARALASGAADYLIKPVMPTDLERVLREQGRPVEQVLVVDDDPDVLSLFTGMLELGRTGLQVITASSGQEALQTMRAAPPDLILLDVMMPDMDGWQLIREKAQDDALKDIPVIMVSARDPAERPSTSPALVGMLGEGLSLSQVFRCTLALANLLGQPIPAFRHVLEQVPDPALE